jgi:hypothetical protein
MNAVWLVRSGDAGRTWSSPSVLVDLGRERGYALQFAQSDTAIDLVWATDATIDHPGGGLTRRVSSDAGASWHQAEGARLPQRIDAVTAVAIGGRLYAAARDSRTDSLLIITWKGSSDPSVRRLPFEPARSLPRMAALGKDSLILVWGIDRMNAYPLFPTLPVPALAVSVAATGCD